MNKKQGKIIAIVGSPRSGKSFLANLLKKHYGGKVFMQGEEKNFPKRIRDDIKKNIHSMERILWFRNKLIENYFVAEKYKKEGKVVILDTFWMSYILHINALTKGFVNKILKKVATIDEKNMSYPDVIIFLKVTEKTIRNFIKLGKRKFDNSEDFIINQALPINKLHQKFFKKNLNIPSKIIIIQRDDMDFSNPDDFQKIIMRIEK